MRKQQSFCHLLGRMFESHRSQTIETLGPLENLFGHYFQGPKSLEVRAYWPEHPTIKKKSFEHIPKV